MNTELVSERLRLRRPSQDDLPAVVGLIGDYDVAKNLTVVPHPYAMEHAEQWLNATRAQFKSGDGDTWAIHLGNRFIGVCSVTRYQGWLSLGYWLGKPHWGKGYATEAATAAAAYAFAEYGVPALVSGYYPDNPASGRVLAKLGFEPAGVEFVRCVSRAATIACNRVFLMREQFVQKKAA
jgi:RimJ/RimL family protein N-acetyltransferase